MRALARVEGLRKHSRLDATRGPIDLHKTDAVPEESRSPSFINDNMGVPVSDDRFERSAQCRKRYGVSGSASHREKHFRIGIEQSSNEIRGSCRQEVGTICAAEARRRPTEPVDDLRREACSIIRGKVMPQRTLRLHIKAARLALSADRAGAHRTRSPLQGRSAPWHSISTLPAGYRGAPIS